jgi:hypothetical protein
MWQMHGTMWSIIHSSQPLVFGAKSHTNEKKTGCIFLFWGGKNLSNYEKKNSKVFHHIWTWILVWRQFFKADFATFWINSRNMLPF